MHCISNHKHLLILTLTFLVYRDALVLVDEADIFLESRSSTEIQRNALVCVMLRLLEYYYGCLFLSSNREASTIDAAIASRITVMLSYPPLDVDGRAKVWKNLVELVPVTPLGYASGESMSRRKMSKFRKSFTVEDYLQLAEGRFLLSMWRQNGIILYLITHTSNTHIHIHLISFGAISPRRPSPHQHSHTKIIRRYLIRNPNFHYLLILIVHLTCLPLLSKLAFTLSFEISIPCSCGLVLPMLLFLSIVPLKALGRVWHPTSIETERLLGIFLNCTNEVLIDANCCN